MYGLLAKIASITPLQAVDASGLQRFTVTVMPACVLPTHGAVPAWLKGQTLTVERTAADPRELGGPGDSLVFPVEEAERWLHPLAVTPAVAHGALPDAVTVTLRWWKDDDPPEVRLHANGVTVTRKLEKQDTGGFTIVVPTCDFFPTPPPVLPVSLTVDCDTLHAECTVLPHAPCARALTTPEGEVYRLENAWYAIDIATQRGAGGICAWRERGRDVDHFGLPANTIQLPFDYAGHVERCYTGWTPSDKIADTAMTAIGVQREGYGIRLAMDGVIDDGPPLRTAVTYTCFTDLPLLVWQRNFLLHTKQAGDAKDEKPKEPVDALSTMGAGFRAAFRAERDGDSGSRVISAYDDQCVVLRGGQVNEYMMGATWKMTAGWALVEHPHRHECMLYLYDPATPPKMGAWFGQQFMTLEPNWPKATVQAGSAFGLTLAATAGERCGATADGAWVAMRIPEPDGRVRVAVIARLRDDYLERGVTVTVGAHTVALTLASRFLPGIGTIWYATADLPAGRMDDAFVVTAAGIAERRPG